MIYLLKLKDYLYTEAIRLIDESIVRLREEVEKDTIHGGIKSSLSTTERFYFLGYLLSMKELRYIIILNCVG